MAGTKNSIKEQKITPRNKKDNKGTKNNTKEQKIQKRPINSAHKPAYVLTPTPSKFSRLQKKRIRILIRMLKRILRDILIHILRSICIFFLWGRIRGALLGG